MSCWYGNRRRNKKLRQKTRFALDELDDNENAFNKKSFNEVFSTWVKAPAALKYGYKLLCIRILLS